MLINFVKALLPDGLLDHFTIDDFKELKESDSDETYYELHLSEKNELPSGYSVSDYQSKGFYKPKTIQDFPIRGKALYLVIKRRRWRHKQTKEQIKSDYSFIAKGVKLTAELSDFLKGTGRDPGRYD
jgi:hypothetical protein